MRVNTFAALLTVFVLLTGLTIKSHAVAGDDNHFSPDPLKGVNTLALEVNGIEDNYYRYGLSAEQLRNDLRQRLEAAGFRIIETRSLGETPGAALLKLDVRLYENSYYYSLGMSLSLRRKVALEGSGFATIQAWSEGKVGALSATEFSKVHRYSSELVGNFISAHKQQNAG